jgi:hypothetical protein
VLGRPPPAGLGTVVVGPDQLVEERVPAEDLVEQQLAVVRLAIVDVEVERPVGRQQLARPGQAGLQEPEIVAERVVVGKRAQEPRLVPPPAEADPRPARY